MIFPRRHPAHTEIRAMVDKITQTAAIAAARGVPLWYIDGESGEMAVDAWALATAILKPEEES